MALWKRGSRYWTLVWFEGKRYAKSTGTGNKRQALRIDERYNDIRRNSHSLALFRTSSSPIRSGRPVATVASGIGPPFGFECRGC